MAVHQSKSKALSNQHPRQAGTFGSAVGQTRKPQHKPKRASPGRFERRGRQLFRFREAVGKTVEFVEMGTSADFPCVEIGFTDKTALHFLIEPRLTMEPSYSDWRTGNLRPLLEWPAQETE